jgi:TPR repeat protein
MARLKRRARDGDAIAAANLAAEYRILRRPVLAFKWWKTAIEIDGNGDDLLEVAYCLQHGVGVRRNLRGAIDAYERAIRAPNTTLGGHEEAYHLATALLEGAPRARRRVTRLLAEANADGDYPQAGELLAQLEAHEKTLQICHCRRRLRRSLGGSSRCKLHR